MTSAATLTLTPDAAGTYVVRVTPSGSTGINNLTAITWTLTVTDALAVTAANSTSFLNTGETTTATVDATVSAAMAASTTAQAATIVVTPLTS